MAQLNMTLPNITNEQLDSKEERKKIMGYLNQLSEQLRFVLNNLDEENFSDDVSLTLENAKKTPELIEQIVERIEEDGSKTRTSIKQNADAIILEAQRASLAEGNLQSSIEVTAEAIVTKVGKNEIISMINQTAEVIQILASKIKLEGYTTINENFAVDLQGNVTLKKGDEVVSFTSKGVEVTNGTYESFFASKGFEIYNNGSPLIRAIPNLPNFLVSIYGRLEVNGYSVIDSSNIGSQSVSNADSLGYSVYVSVNDNMRPYGDGNMSNGTSTGRWSSVWAFNGTILTSDKRQKTDIRELTSDPRYLRFAKMIVPSIYKMLNGTSGREHIGFIAQDIELAMDECGISSMEFAGLIKAPVYAMKLKDENGEELQEYDTTSAIIDYSYHLRYDEFVPLLLLYQQDNDRRITELENKLI